MKIVISLFLILPFATHAYSLSGNFKSYPIVKDLVHIDRFDRTWLNSAKIQWQNSFFDGLKVEAGYELTTVLEKYPPLAPTIQSYRALDLDYYLHENYNPGHYETNFAQNLNRLNVAYSFNYGDLILGRQPIAFGSAKSINPTDVLTPFAINTIDKEERTGIDALVVKIPIKDYILVEAAAVEGNKLKAENSAYYIRPKLNIDQYDIAFTLMEFKKNDLIGIDLQHPLYDAGVWLEAAYVNQAPPHLKDFIRATMGGDYKFTNSLYMAFEYHYNGASMGNSYTYSPEYIYLRDYHYGIGTFSYEFMPLLTGTMQTYFNVQHGSAFSSLKLDYNLSENSYLSLGTYLGLGDKLKTEFGKYGRIYYSSFRYYF